MQTKMSVEKLAVSAVLLALSITLTFVKVWAMPMGGEVTLLSMLPVALVSFKYGLKQGFLTAFLFSLFHLIKGIFSGNVFVYCVTAWAVIICVLFDYLVPFTAIGIAGIFKKGGAVGAALGMALACVIRFACHFVTGVVIWGQWAPEGQSKFIYSLLYNGQYMLPECVFSCIAIVLLAISPFWKRYITDRA